MTKKLRGSYHVDGRRSLTLTTSDDDKLMDVGFRLVHDGDNRVFRGGGWDNSAQLARVADRVRGGPANRINFLGFRLVREGT
jgi:formylglycine-generating enzyme required for sulfatase activity